MIIFILILIVLAITIFVSIAVGIRLIVHKEMSAKDAIILSILYTTLWGLFHYKQYLL